MLIKIIEQAEQEKAISDILNFLVDLAMVAMVLEDKTTEGEEYNWGRRIQSIWWGLEPPE